MQPYPGLMADVLENGARQANRTVRRLSEREIAMALVLQYAEQQTIRFSLFGFYDDDADFMADLAARLSVPNDKKFKVKLTKVVRTLVRYGVFNARMSGTDKQYLGEPAKQMSYFMRAGKPELLRREYKVGVWMGPQGEAEFLLRHAYPKPETPHSDGSKG